MFNGKNVRILNLLFIWCGSLQDRLARSHHRIHFLLQICALVTALHRYDCLFCPNHRLQHSSQLFILLDLRQVNVDQTVIYF